MKSLTKIVIIQSIVFSSLIPASIDINEEIKRSQETINQFIEAKKKEKELLEMLPNSGFFAMATNFFVENIVAPFFSKYGDIKVEHARSFLQRSFEDEIALKRAVDNFRQNPENVDYITKIFSTAEQNQTLHKNDGKAFMEVMRSTHYPHIEDRKQIAEKKEDGSYLVQDSVFYQYCAATFMAFNIYENGIKLPKKKRHKKIVNK